MNSEQIELIQSSWKKVLPIADTAADLFYNRLFEVAPAVRDLFPDDMSGQKKALLATLGRVVGSLNDLDNIVPNVQELGVRHVGYGADPAHYPVVGEALLWTLEQGLGEEWNDDFKAAWASAYGILSQTMIDAAKGHLKEEEAKAAEAADREAKAAEKARAEAEAKAKAEKEEAERKAKAELESAAKARAEKEEAKSEAEAAALAKIEQEKSADVTESGKKRARKRTKKGGPGSIATAMTSDQKNAAEEQATGPQRQLVVFDLDLEQYGLDISVVREIIRMQDITAVPRAPEFVEGVINLRGNVIPVIDLRVRFGMEEVERDDDFRIVVVHVGNDEIGMIVDAVTEVSRVPESSIEPPSTVIAGDDADYLTGIANTGQEMIILLDIGRLISVEQLHAVSSKVDDQQQAA